MFILHIKGFLSHKYGKRFLKPCLNEKEYDALKMEMGKMQHKDIENLFEFFYTVDQNDLNDDFKYNLKPRVQIMKELGCNMKTDMKKWCEVENCLIEAMQNAAESLYQYTEFNERQRNSFFLSGMSNYYFEQ